MTQKPRRPNTTLAGTIETTYVEADGKRAKVKDLVIGHLPLVRHVVDRTFGAGLPPQYQEELISVGTLGLVEAAQRFDESRGVKFHTFAFTRVRGAIADYLRNNDVLSKTARQKLKRLRAITRDFQSRNGRKPRLEELAREADMKEDDVLEYLSYEKWDFVASLDEHRSVGHSLENLLHPLASPRYASPYKQLEWKEDVEQLRQAIEELPDRERYVIVMYYLEELHMAEIAAVLGVTESRVSQLHTKALYDLARKMGRDNG